MTDIFRYLENEKGITLTMQQREVVNHVDGPLLALAVPGSGKTTSMVIRTGYLIMNCGIPADNILTMTFSKSAATDMKNRFNSLFGDFVEEDVHFSTIHSFAYGVVMRYFKKNNIKFKLIEDNSEVSKTVVLKSIYKKINNDYISEDKLEELINDIGFVKNKMLDINKIENDKFEIPKFKEVFIAYENFKKKNGFIDFDDMLTICYYLLINNEDILNFYKSKYKYFVLDEAQDSSMIQFTITKLLAYPQNNVFFCADDDQCIYSFRASEPGNLLNFKDIYPKGKILFMEENFRSTKDIVDLSNKFIKTNKNRYEKEMQTSNCSNRPVTIVKVSNEIEQLQHIVSRLKDINNYKDSAILFRTNMSAIPLIDALCKNNIPFYIKDHNNKFFTHWVVQDILSFLKLSLNPNDIKSLEKIYYKANAYISKNMIDYIKTNNQGENLLDTLLKAPWLKDFQKYNIMDLKINLNLLKNLPAQGAIDIILYTLDYDKYLRDNAKKLGYSYDTLSDIVTTLKIISFDVESIEEMFSKLEFLKMAMYKANNNKNKNAVTLTTIHSSKGLEFENVFIVDMIDEIFPSSQSITAEKDGDIDLMEEERRLCYVAITRAKNYIDLIVPQKRNNRKTKESKFIKEINEICNSKKHRKKPNVNKILSDIKTNTLNIDEGDRVNHTVFGKGVVKRREGNIITIAFDKKGIKKLDLKTCAENYILTKI